MSRTIFFFRVLGLLTRGWGSQIANDLEAKISAAIRAAQAAQGSAKGR